jgi:hypothetical protein
MSRMLHISIFGFDGGISLAAEKQSRLVSAGLENLLGERLVLDGASETKPPDTEGDGSKGTLITGSAAVRVRC